MNLTKKSRSLEIVSKALTILFAAKRIWYIFILKKIQSFFFDLEVNNYFRESKNSITLGIETKCEIYGKVRKDGFNLVQLYDTFVFTTQIEVFTNSRRYKNVFVVPKEMN